MRYTKFYFMPDNQKPSDTQNAATDTFGKEKKRELDALAAGDMDTALDAREKMEAAKHPEPATGTADIGNASGTQSLGH